METTIRTFRSGSLKQRTSQPILPYADSPNQTSSRGGRAFKQQGSNTCRNLVGAVLVAALLGVATVAFTGVPGVVQPGFRRTKKTAAAQQTHDDHDADSVDEHWHHDEHSSHDYVGDDHEEQSEQAILDHQIRMEQEHAGSHHADHLPGDTHTAHHEQHEQHEQQHHDEHGQHEQHHEQHDQHDEHHDQHEQHEQHHEEEHAAEHPFDHDAVHTHAQQVGDLARDTQMKKDQAELAGVHGEQGKAAHPQELLASIAEMQKQVPTPAPTPAPTEQQLPQAGDQQQHQDSQQQEQHTAQEAVASPAPTPAPEPVPTPAPQADEKQADSKADPTQPVVATGIYALNARDKDDHEVALSQYAGKVTIVVNVASQCGYTAQNYKGLVELYKEFKDKGFEVLAFPCNAFGKQEPGSCSEIQHFAEEQFHATFPIFNKIEVNGPNTHPVFKFLKDHTPLGHGGGADVEWNFAKWVVNKKGYPVVRYPSAMDISALRGWIDYEVSRN